MYHNHNTLDKFVKDFPKEAQMQIITFLESHKTKLRAAMRYYTKYPLKEEDDHDYGILFMLYILLE